MSRLLPWRWHVGSNISVVDDKVYDLNECDTRDDAIACGLQETPVGESFHIVEARLYDRKTAPSDDIERFAKQRNHEVCEVLAHGLASCIRSER